MIPGRQHGGVGVGLCPEDDDMAPRRAVEIVDGIDLIYGKVRTTGSTR